MQVYNLNPTPVTYNGVTYTSCTVPRRAVRSARHRNQPAGPANVEPVHARCPTRADAA